MGSGGTSLYLVLLRYKYSCVSHLPSLPEVTYFQKFICPFYFRPDLGKPEVSLGSGMTNWCWSLGTVHYLLIHHSEGHRSLSNLFKSLWIAWLKSTHLYPTPHAPRSLRHFRKHVCQPEVPFRRAALMVSLHPSLPPSQRSLQSPELFWKERTSCPLCQRFPRAGWRSNFHLFLKNEQHFKFCHRAKFIQYKRRPLLVSSHSLYDHCDEYWLGVGPRILQPVSLGLKTLINFYQIITGQPGVPEACTLNTETNHAS